MSRSIHLGHRGDRAQRVVIQHQGRPFAFVGPSARDHLLDTMERTKRFYEIDVLELIGERLDGRGGVAVDCGAFVGTHSVYFARVLGLTVHAFEPNVAAYVALEHNIEANRADATTYHAALGGKAGRASLATRSSVNQGGTRLVHGTGDIEVVTLDSVEVGQVRLLKIDVEGAELDVLRGARLSIDRDQPLLCIEIHGAAALHRALRLLPGYVVVDCRGYSPTYVMEPSRVSRLRTWLARSAWVLSSMRRGRRGQWALRRWAGRLAAIT